MARHQVFGVDHTAPHGSAVDLEEVARVAYALYERRGRVDGHDLDDWLEAERIVQRQSRTDALSLV